MRRKAYDFDVYGGLSAGVSSIVSLMSIDYKIQYQCVSYDDYFLIRPTSKDVER